MKLDTKIFLSDGTLVNDSFSDGLYRAIVNGVNFCGSTREDLLKAIGFFFSTYTSNSDVIVERPLAERMRNVLFGKNTLEERQKAFAILDDLSNNPIASQTVSYIKTKPTSFGATYLTKILGKSDFSYVTPVEISETVPSILHKAELLKELAERVSI
jgi:hypothetical protein